MMSMDNTPGFSGKAPDGCTTRGGNYWTLITPGTWKVLHADLHYETIKPRNCAVLLGFSCFPGVS
ncbi:MAG: hypothetical protein KAX52_07965, partial [Pseudomonas sp.]|nr:hypothetical protein [Pseudomonas sp.]